jgi:branched-chain amino acid transport system permease protein
MTRTRTTRSLVVRSGAGVGLVLAAALLMAQRPDETRALLLGLGTGCLVAALALGVVLTYKGSGVINFASGAMAMYSAYAYDALRRDGEIFLPPLPRGVSFGGALAFWPALATTLALAALLGLACHLLVFRPLRQAPPLMKVVASVGVLITLQALVVLRFENAPRAILPIFAKEPVRLPGDLTIPSDQLVLTGVVVAIAIALWALLAFTRFGLATRAAAENERGAAILGYSPDWLAGANWVLSTVLVGLLGVLVATVNGSVTPSSITLLVVPALGAALIGGFTSFGLTTVAALAIAMVQNLIQYLSTLDWFPHTTTGPVPGVRDAVPLIVIVAVLFVRGRGLPSRGALEPERLPAAPEPSRVAVKAIALGSVCVAGLLVLSPDWRLGITNTLIGIVVCLSLVVVTGFVGQISLGQMALAGIAGFTLAKLATAGGVPFPLAPLCGAVAATAVGLLVAVSAVRIRGVQLAVVTFAGAMTVESLVFRNPAWSGGNEGAQVPPPRFLGMRFGPNDSGSLDVLGYAGDGKLPNPWFGVFCLLVVLAVAAAVVNLRRSAIGRRMLAVRANERAAAAAGIDVVATKLLAFGVSAFIAGLAGALSGYRFGSVSPGFFGGFASLTFLAFAFLGGITSVGGAVVGGALVAGGLSFVAMHQLLGIGDEYTLLIGGLGLIVNAVLNPQGIAGAMRELRERLDGRRRRRAMRAAPRSVEA